MQIHEELVVSRWCTVYDLVYARR